MMLTPQSARSGLREGSGSRSFFSLESSSPRRRTTSPPNNNGDLQRRLALEAGERDAARLALARLRRAVAFYHAQIAAATQAPGSPPPRRSSGEKISAACLQRVRELTRQLETEMQLDDGSGSSIVLAKHGSPPTSPTRDFEMLRTSLEEAQRRCESLNSDMACEAEANEELVESLNAVKEANRSLLEQIRTQTEEIGQVTQLRLKDEAHIQQVSRQHQEEGERIRKSARQQAVAVREATEKQCASMTKRFSDLRQQFVTRLIRMGREVAELRQEHRNLKGKAVEQASEMTKHFRVLTDDVDLRQRGLVDNAQHHIATLELSVSDKEIHLVSERDRRQGDSISWNRQLVATQADIDNTKTGMSRQVDILSVELQAGERCLSGERRAWVEERAQLDSDIDASSQKVASDRRALDVIQQKLVQTESAVASAECSTRSLEQALAELRKQIREADDALAAAVSSNEHLRRQMEEQRQRQQDRNEVDLGDSRVVLEQKLESASKIYRNDMDLAKQQIQEMEDEFEKVSNSTRCKQAEYEAVSNARAVLEREATVWSSQQWGAKAALQSTEQEFAEACKSAAMTRVELQAGVETLEIQSHSMEMDIDRLVAQITEMRKDAAATEVEAETRASAGELAVKDLEAQLADLRRRLITTLEQQQRLDTETAHTRETGTEKQEGLEKYISEVVNECLEERAAYAAQLGAEQKAARQVKEQFLAEHDLAKSKLSLMHEESRLRRQAAEKERKTVEDMRRREVSEVAGTEKHHHEQTEALENALERSRQLLNESSANLGFVLQELAHEERESALELAHLREEVRVLDAALEKALREERDLDHRFGPDVLGAPQSAPPAVHSRLENQIHLLHNDSDKLKNHVNALASTVASLSPRSPQASIASPPRGATSSATLHDSGLRITPSPIAWSPRPLSTMPFTPPVRTSAGGRVS
jgi:hypothetical protein